MKYLALLLLSTSLYAQSEVDLTFEDPGCTTGNPCTIQMYRSTCTASDGMGRLACPNYPDPSFILLANTPNSLSGIITSTNTKWVYKDINGDSTRPDLVPAQLYGYAVTAIYNGDPSRSPSPGSFVLSIPFQLNVANAPVYPITGTCYIVK